MDFRSSIHNYNIDNVLVPLDPAWSKIVISLSGGADSAMLAYLLCDLITKNNYSIEVHTISNVRQWRELPWQSDVVLNVLDYIQNRFPTIKFIRHGTFIPPSLEAHNMGKTIHRDLIEPSIRDSVEYLGGSEIIDRSYAEFVCKTNNIDAWYSGMTKNPDIEFLKNTQPERTLEFTNTENDLKLLMDVYGGIVACMPFRFTTKDWVVKQYKRLELMELFELTRSCEGHFEGTDYRTYVYGQEVPTCGTCYWCVERNWALKQNGI